MMQCKACPGKFRPSGRSLGARLPRIGDRMQRQGRVAVL